jgi:hypothetical protein
MTPHELRQILTYEPDTGRLRWIHGRGSRAKGSIAGTHHKDGTIRVMINRHTYDAHVLAWAIYYDEWPETKVYHVNDRRTDNRLANLTLTPKVHPCTGVTKEHGKYRVRITHKKKRYSLGCFDDYAEACMAYQLAREKFLEDISSN